MCGIFGILHFDGRPVERAALQAMARITVHRGPDEAVAERLELSRHAWPRAMRRLDAIVERTVASYCVSHPQEAEPANA